jgi:H+/Na+-translocating ferredoxin:NAD+ oxidoreductase subunit A
MTGRIFRAAAAALLLGALSAGAVSASEPGVMRGARVLGPDRIRIDLTQPVGNLAPGNFGLADARSPDVGIEIREVTPVSRTRLLLRAAQRLDPAQTYHIRILDPPSEREVRPSPWAMFLTVVLSSALINNFVFTRYLGLCIFFGVSKRRDTAIGMGFTFLFVMIVTAMISWALYTWVMSPLHLRFLEVLVFIGVVASLVQGLDTILKKTHRALHQKFGIYLVLITTNCIILAVPLLNAAGHAGPADALALAIGSGLGFALALFLMSCARERVELARVPASFQGLPIAFALAGLFALAFMGFSGLNFLR